MREKTGHVIHKSSIFDPDLQVNYTKVDFQKKKPVKITPILNKLNKLNL